MENNKKPELLAPAGTLEKLKIALTYGADAVYLGGTLFSLRKAASNFTELEMQKGIEFAHERNKKIYLTLNIGLQNEDLKNFQACLKTLKTLNPDGIIVSDPGLFSLLKREVDTPLHISTQASVTNTHSSEFWRKNGAKRIVLARELSISEIKKIKENVNIEIEVFAHGAMCIGYSGKCVISNHIANRDANRGGCIQNCRYPYNIYNPDKTILKTSSFYMSSKDLMTIKLLPEFIKSNIDSLKIEGRMKSNLYVANTVSVYRDAINTIYELMKKSDTQTINFSLWEKELSKVSNRTFTTGSFETRAFKDSIRAANGNYHKEVEYIGTIKEVLPDKLIALQVKSTFSVGEEVEVMLNDSKNQLLIIDKIFNVNNESITKAMPNTLVLLPWFKGAKERSILRRIIKNNRSKESE